MGSSYAATEAHEEEVNKIRSKIDKMEDEIYRDFCNQIGVSNIRYDLTYTVYICIVHIFHHWVVPAIDNMKRNS